MKGAMFFGIDAVLIGHDSSFCFINMISQDAIQSINQIPRREKLLTNFNPPSQFFLLKAEKFLDGIYSGFITSGLFQLLLPSRSVCLKSDRFDTVRSRGRVRTIFIIYLLIFP
jgi:hypothetical protein